MANTKNFIAKNGYSTGDGYDMPDVRPSLLLDFANSKTLDPRIKFTRFAQAKYWDGYTTTKADENLLPRSSQLSTTYWSPFRSTNTASQTGPDGSSNALLHAGDGTGAGTGVYLAFNYSNYGTDYALTLYAKANGSQYVYIGTNNADAKSVAYNLSGSGTVISAPTGYSATINAIGDGWYRCRFLLDTTTAVEDNFYVMGLCQSDGTLDGTYTSSDSVYFFGPQISTGQYFVPYIPTTSNHMVRYQPVLQTTQTARFDHDPVTGESKGLLIESAATNLIKCSSPEDTDTFGTNGWQDYYGFRAYKNTVIAPDGTQTAATIRAIAGGGTTGATMYVNNAIVPTNTTDHTFSAYLKNGGVRPLGLVVMSVYGNGNAANNYNVKFDLTDGTINTLNSGTAKIEDCGNGWYRCSITLSLTSGGSYYPQVGSYGSAAINSSFLMWGAQLEQGSFATSFIPTNGYTVTRDSDLASTTDVSWLNTENFSVLTDSATPVAGGEPFVFQVSNNAAEDRFSMRFRSESANQGGYMVMVSGGSTQLDTIASATALTRYNTTTQKYNFYKLAMAFEENNAAITDGYGTATDTSCVPPVSLSQLTLGANYSTVYSNWIKKIAFYPKRLSNTALQQLVED